MRIDLHSHSTRSDGRLAPAALVARARAEGLTHLALTDHDAVDGLPEAGAAAREVGLELVGGIEITTELHGRELHVLGLCFAPDAPALAALAGRARDERARRIERMVEALAKAGVPVRLDDVLAEANGGTLARPHLARTLVAYGYAESVQRAFDRFLAPGTAGDVPRWRPALAEVVERVRASGGVTSVAHPGVNRVSRQELRRLAETGVDAVEAHHPDHPPNQAEAYARWAAELGLSITGGSDFHGDGPDSHGPPGTALCPPEAFLRLAALAKSRRPGN